MTVQLRAICNIGNVSYSSFDARARFEAEPGFRIDFDVHMSLRKSPNASKVSIYNVATNDAMGFLANRKAASVRLFAANAPSDPLLLSLGDPRKDGIKYGSTIDRILEVSFMDGLRAKKTSRVVVSFKGETKVSDVLLKVAQEMGVPLGAVVLDTEDITLKRGFSEAGSGFDILARLARMTRCDFSVQNGRIVFLGQNSYASKLNRLYTDQNRSLLAAPQPRDKGRIVFETVLDPRMIPGTAFGARYSLSPYGSGFFKALAVQHTGSTWTGGKTIIEAKQMNTVSNKFVLV